jgi:hypothetical protein
MPLSSPASREELHCRRIELRGYRRNDGFYDIEAHFTDTKSRDMAIEDGRRVLKAGQPLHDMSVRLLVDCKLTVLDVEASTDRAPQRVCTEASATLQSIKGLCIGPGWSAALRERLSGTHGCTHLRELLGPLATIAFQTLSEVRKAAPEAVDATGRPKKIDSCYAYASNREVVLHRWPRFYDGPPEGSTAGSHAEE